MNDDEDDLSLELENIKAPKELPGRGGFLKRNPVALVAIALVPLFLLIEGPSLTRLIAGSGEVHERMGKIVWGSDFSRAMGEAAKSGKPVLVDFGASWCPGCVAMDEQVWPDKEVGDLVMQNYIPVHLDFDDAASAPVIQQYQVQGIPEVLILHADGRVRLAAQLMDKAEVLAFLKEGLRKPEDSTENSVK